MGSSHRITYFLISVILTLHFSSRFSEAGSHMQMDKTMKVARRSPKAIASALACDTELLQSCKTFTNETIKQFNHWKNCTRYVKCQAGDDTLAEGDCEKITECQNTNENTTYTTLADCTGKLCELTREKPGQPIPVNQSSDSHQHHQNQDQDDVELFRMSLQNETKTTGKLQVENVPNTDNAGNENTNSSKINANPIAPKPESPNGKEEKSAKVKAGDTNEGTSSTREEPRESKHTQTSEGNLQQSFGFLIGVALVALSFKSF